MAITGGNSAASSSNPDGVSSDLQHCYALFVAVGSFLLREVTIVQIVIVPSPDFTTYNVGHQVSKLMPWEIRWFMVNIYPAVVKRGMLENPLFVDFPCKPPFAGEYM